MFEYDALAKYFDLYFNHTNDIPFWKEMAQRLGSPILELSCGTGRLVFPVAETGVCITGIDISIPMLKIAEKKLKKYPIATQKRVKLIKENTISFTMNNKFRAIFCAESFWAVTDEEQTSMLNSIKKHLLPRGYLVMSVSNFHVRPEDMKSHYLKTCKQYPSLGFTLVRQCFINSKGGSNIEQIIHFLDRVYENGAIKRIVTERTERQRTKEELVNLLKSNGFQVRDVYGEYDMTKWSDNSKWTIVVAQLSSGNLKEQLKAIFGNWFAKAK